MDATNPQLWHDVRGVIAAISANIDFIGSHELPPQAAEALGEIVHELALVNDVIALVGSRDDATTLQIDLRAVLMLSRGATRLRVDATQPRFAVRATRGALLSLGAAILDATAGAPAVQTDARPKSFSLNGLLPERAADLAAASAPRNVGLVATAEGSTLTFRND